MRYFFMLFIGMMMASAVGAGAAEPLPVTERWTFDGHGQGALDTGSTLRAWPGGRFDPLERREGQAAFHADSRQRHGFGRVALQGPAVLAEAQQFGVAFWVRPTVQSGPWRAIFSFGPDLPLISRVPDHDDRFGVQGLGPSLARSRPWWDYSFYLPRETWSHVALTADGAVVRLYRDGREVTTFEQTGGLSSEALFLGARSSGANLESAHFDELVLHVGAVGLDWAQRVYQGEASADASMPEPPASTGALAPGRPGWRETGAGYRLEGPATVRAGDPAKVVLQLDDSRTGPATFVLGSWQQQRPAIWQVMVAAEHAAPERVAADPQAAGGVAVVTRGVQGYDRLWQSDFWPAGDQPVYLWVRSRGGPVCLRDAAGRERAWVGWNATDAYAWHLLGAYTAEEIGGSFSLTQRPTEGQMALDQLLLTSAGDFRPVAAELPRPGHFVWATDTSSVGEHQFPVRILYDGHEIVRTVWSVNVVDREPAAPAMAWMGEGFEAVPLPESTLSTEPSEAALRLFAPGELGPGEHRFGPYTFPLPEHAGGAGMLALASSRNVLVQTYPGSQEVPVDRYPEAVSIPVDRPAAGLVFLHAELGGLNMGEEVLRYQVHFADGSLETVPVLEGDGVLGWLMSSEATGAVQVHQSFTGRLTNQVFLMTWPVPAAKREVKITSVRAISARSRSIPVVLGLGTLTGLTRPVAPPDPETPDAVTVNFAQAQGRIHRTLFGTNDQEALVAHPVGDSAYQSAMAAMAMPLVRLHLSGRMDRIFPDAQATGDFTALAMLDRTFQRADRAGQAILFCLARPPKWVNLADADDRQRYAAQCERLVRYLLEEKGYPITHWQLFNEPYCSGIAEDRGYWHLYNVLAPRIRAIDPSAQIGGPVLCWPDLGVIEDFLQHCAAETDFLAWHLYATGSAATPTEDLMARTALFGQQSRRIRALTDRYLPGRSVPQALTEYNINYGWKPHDPRQATAVGAVWTASVLKHLAEAGHEIAQSWHSKGGGTFGLLSTTNQVRPVAELLQILGLVLGESERVTAVSNHPSLEVLAGQGPQGRVVVLINKSEQARAVELSLLNGPVGQANPMDRPVRRYAIHGEQRRFEETQTRLFEPGESRTTIQLPGHGVVVHVFSGE